MNNVDRYLYDLYEMEEITFITENMIEKIKKFSNDKLESLKKAFKNKDHKTISKFLGNVNVSTNKIKKSAFNKDPDIKNKYNSNLKKFKISDDDKKSSAVLGYTILNKMTEYIEDESTLTKIRSLINKLGIIISRIGLAGNISAAILIIIGIMGEAAIITMTTPTVFYLGVTALSIYLISLLFMLIGDLLTLI